MFYPNYMQDGNAAAFLGCIEGRIYPVDGIPGEGGVRIDKFQ
jgi:hypothetical protein